MNKFMKPIPIRTARGYWGDMIGIYTDDEGGVFGICELVGCTYSDTHTNDLIPIKHIYHDDKAK